MKFLLGTKQNMTQVFDEDGTVYPATIIKTSPNVISQIKTLESDGYTAVQVAFGTKAEKNMKKPQKGHLKDLGNFATLREFRLTDVSPYKVGDKIESSIFTENEEIEVSSISKGKGFQSAIKRHGFHGGPRSHGQKHSEREPGSIGAGGYQRVFKGTRMAGRMGSDRVTVTNLKVLKISPETNEIFISGAIAGRRGTLVEIKSA